MPAKFKCQHGRKDGGADVMYLIGDGSSKRSVYFDRAANVHGLKVHHIDWKDINKGFDFKCFEGAVVKLDPPSYNTFSLAEARDEICIYMEKLKRLAECGAIFLNTPDAILDTLDKRNAKAVLGNMGLNVTPLVMEHVDNAGHLLVNMIEKDVFSVFIKPVIFSGAAGVAAFRMHKKSGKMKVYTSCKMQNGILVNTKKLHILEDKKEVMELLSEIIKLDVIVERWVPKDTFEGKSYDLRIVHQFGHVAADVARGSSGPITNLHLNNIVISAGDIRKSVEMRKGDLYHTATGLCDSAVSAFGGLLVAGVDILFEKTSLKPGIIEINGQGDLIYKDIYDRNAIYMEQAAECRKLEGYINAPE